ncbi:MAG: membrane protein insertase YidC [Pelagibacterales bacterium]|nr:membrane protein insertase YidC [Pelagibacterales bacterium]
MQDNKNITLAAVLSVIILVCWTWFYEKPKAEKRLIEQKLYEETQKAEKQKNVTQAVQISDSKNPNTTSASTEIKNNNVEKITPTTKNRDDILSETSSKRIQISSESLHGSISLEGARFDDLTLAKYFVTSEKKEEVKLFSPSQSKERYFADFGWLSSDSTIDLPKPNTLWKSNSDKLTPQNPISLSWTNKDNIEFIIKISLDENYMFSVTQTVKNNSNKDISLATYGRVNRSKGFEKGTYILHEGAIGVFNDILQEVTYEDLIEEKNKDFTAENGGWLGITDKYWLSSLIPDKNISYKANFNSSYQNKTQFFNVEFIGQEFAVNKNSELSFENHMFAGAKKIKLLDQYSKDFDIKLFDRAVDFGWFYFLTKPFLFIIDFLYKFLGNFGLAILAMTVLIKLALFPMANKSYTAIAKVKKLQPKIDEIKKKFKEDRVAFNREMMELYKKEKVNPAAGCLPILIQIPIFFSLYKVLYVTLDMRQAPFYGWIQDLSAPDPTSIFNLFGLLPFETSTMFTIGIWPILMGITMIIQQKLSPVTSDPTQAKIMKFMPYVLTFVLAAFPAGLVIYWTWSNVLSILQQWFINRRLK